VTISPFATFDLWAGLLGGLALFLFGMDIMTQALKLATGDQLKEILRKLTRNRFIGVGMGALVTAIIQSSSVTTVLLVGFISAGLMSMSQSVAVIIGANIGTTITAQILAFKVTALALPLIALGFLMTLAARENQVRQYGFITMGLGLVFFGMAIMSDGLSPLRSYPPFIDFMLSMQSPLLAAGVGVIFTALVQSSSATTGILIVMASSGLIALEPAIAIALGANVGTCVTATLASIGKTREAVRAAVVHIVFNLAGVALWILFIPQLAWLGQLISPSYPELAGLDRLAAETPRQIANIHTFFNLANALIFVGFTAQIARFVEWIIPDKPLDVDEALRPKYLDDSLLSTPSIAIETTRLEIARMGEQVLSMVKATMPAAIRGSELELLEIADKDKVVDALHKAIIDFLGKVSLAHLSSRQSRELMALVKITNDLESIGDQIATGLVISASKRIQEGVTVSEQTAEVLTEFHQLVSDSVEDTLTAFRDKDLTLARSVRRRKKSLAELSRSASLHGFGRLHADLPNRLATYAREMEVVEILSGVFSTARRIAKTELDIDTKIKN